MYRDYVTSMHLPTNKNGIFITFQNFQATQRTEVCTGGCEQQRLFDLDKDFVNTREK